MAWPFDIIPNHYKTPLVAESDQKNLPFLVTNLRNPLPNYKSIMDLGIKMCQKFEFPVLNTVVVVEADISDPTCMIVDASVLTMERSGRQRGRRSYSASERMRDRPYQASRSSSSSPQGLGRDDRPYSQSKAFIFASIDCIKNENVPLMPLSLNREKEIDPKSNDRMSYGASLSNSQWQGWVLEKQVPPSQITLHYGTCARTAKIEGLILMLKIWRPESTLFQGNSFEAVQDLILKRYYPLLEGYHVWPIAHRRLVCKEGRWFVENIDRSGSLVPEDIPRNPEGGYAFAILQNGEIIIDDRSVPFQTAAVAKGVLGSHKIALLTPVLAAGEIWFKNAELDRWNLYSGTYRIPERFRYLVKLPQDKYQGF